MRKKLGVMGGMGPEATSYFYENMIKHTRAVCDQEHVDMVILSHASISPCISISRTIPQIGMEVTIPDLNMADFRAQCNYFSCPFMP